MRNMDMLQIDAAVLGQIYELVGWPTMALRCGLEPAGASMYISRDHRIELQRMLILSQLDADTEHFFLTELDAAEAVDNGN